MLARERYLVTSVDRIWCHIKKFQGLGLRQTSYKVKLSERKRVPFTVDETPRQHLSNDEEDYPALCAKESKVSDHNALDSAHERIPAAPRVQNTRLDTSPQSPPCVPDELTAPPTECASRLESSIEANQFDPSEPLTTVGSRDSVHRPM